MRVVLLLALAVVVGGSAVGGALGLLRIGAQVTSLIAAHM